MDRTPILFAHARIYSHREIALNEFAHVQLCSGLRGRRQHETHILEATRHDKAAAAREVAFSQLFRVQFWRWVCKPKVLIEVA